MWTPAFSAHEVKTTEGTVALAHRAPGIFTTTIVGRGDEQIARAILEASELILAADGHIVAFHDWMGVTGYTSEARTLITSWSRGRTNVKVTLLFESRILAMGVSVVALALPGVVSLSDRALFSAARDGAIATANATARRA